MDASGHIRPEQQLYVKHRARGKTLAECARRVGISRTTATAWEKEDWFWPAIDAEQDKILGDPTPWLDELVPEAWKQLGKLLKSKQPGITLGAVQDVLDRRYGKPRQRQEITGEAGAPVEFVIVQPKDATE